MSQFMETRDHIYRELTLQFLSALHVEATSAPRCQEGYVSFCLDSEFYKLV